MKLRFNVVKALSPALFDVGVTANPAKTSTTFIISHAAQRAIWTWW